MKVIAVSQERRNEMRQRITKYHGVGLAMLVMTLMVMGVGVAYAEDAGKGATSYAPVDIKEDFASIMARIKAAKPSVEKNIWICSICAMT